MAEDAQSEGDTSPVDYRRLLIKYIEHVGQGGFDFIKRAGAEQSRDPVSFTGAELTALVECGQAYEVEIKRRS